MVCDIYINAWEFIQFYLENMTNFNIYICKSFFLYETTYYMQNLIFFNTLKGHINHVTIGVYQNRIRRSQF